ncbi:uncharacterized protein [Primulina huaijiensis]|uniref:uncharacterized protein isoform X2 n=1 Tax=Primulina huaijiensis TaxID=1492673 RepID=UPI003CC749F4
MAGEKDIKKSEQTALDQISDSSIKLPEKDMVKDGGQSDSVTSVSGVKGAIDHSPVSEQGAYYPPTSCYDYYYPGYNGTFTQSADKGYFNAAGSPYTGIQSDNNTSLLYYVPGYSPYPTGYVGADGKQAFTSSEYLRQPIPYGSEAFSSYTYDSTYTGNGLSGTAARSANMKSLMTPSGSGKSNGFSAMKTNNNYSGKTSPLHFNSKFQQQSASKFSKSMYQNNPINPLNKFGSGYQSTGLMRREVHPTGKFSMITDQNRRYYLQQGPASYQSNGREWNNNFRQKHRENFSRSGEFESSTELTRGPRGDNRNDPMKLPTEVEMPAPAIERSVYNSKDFQIEYVNAKFYVIKSYSEDDIHKCVKYGVWSSTPNGNKKLDAAFHEADGKAKETGVKCPVFLFFSVNGSGQFVGVAEMIGKVDFSKNMDFWQLDKWNGFFPIKWHIIKDIPNTLLRHIILENNENRAVTYSRDTQEVGLKEGLEILGIFKNYSEKTSVLDDFNFYENREKSLKAKRNAKQVSQPQTNGFNRGDFEMHLEAAGATGEKSVNTNLPDPSSLVSLTKNLSINSQTAKSST